ncbi:phosphopantetheine-binding protein [Rhodanobacter lindaniclasticus]
MPRLCGSTACPAHLAPRPSIVARHQGLRHDRSGPAASFEIIANQAKVEVDAVKPESTLKDLGVASLEAIELIFDIEEHFDIHFPDQQGANFDSDTAQSLVDAVQKALDEKAAG